MKAFFRGNKLVLSRSQEYKEMSRIIALMVKELEKLRSTCEDRGAETFPVDTVKRLIELGTTLREMGKGLDIPEEYLQAVIKEKDPSKYFEGTIHKADEDRRLYERRIECLGMLADMLSEN